jgi:hypothetical protein
MEEVTTSIQSEKIFKGIEFPLSHFQKVCQFHIECGVNIPKEEQRNIFTEDPKLVQEAFNFIKEECNEYLKGLREDDKIEQLDGLVDTSYVVLRLCALIGSNMDKLEYEHKHEWKPETLKDLEIRIDSTCVSIYELIEDQLVEMDQCIREKDYDRLVRSLYDLEYIVKRIGLILLKENGLKKTTRPEDTWTYWEEAFECIHDNNMNKLCASEEEAIKTVNEKYKDDPLYTTVTYRKAPDNKHWVVYDENRQKVLKSYKWVQVDLSHFFV